MKTESKINEADEVIRIAKLKDFYNLPGNEKFKRHWSYCDDRDFWVLMKGSKVRCGGQWSDNYPSEWSNDYDRVMKRGIWYQNQENRAAIEKELIRLMQYDESVELIW